MEPSVRKKRKNKKSVEKKRKVEPFFYETRLKLNPICIYPLKYIKKDLLINR